MVKRLSDEFGQYELELKCSACHHTRTIYPNLLAHICGWHAELTHVERRLRCSKCGAKKCNLRAIPIAKPRGTPLSH